jgi:hypothetical protein
VKIFCARPELDYAALLTGTVISVLPEITSGPYRWQQVREGVDLLNGLTLCSFCMTDALLQNEYYVMFANQRAGSRALLDWMAQEDFITKECPELVRSYLNESIDLAQGCSSEILIASYEHGYMFVLSDSSL